MAQLNLSELKELSDQVMDGTDVYIRVDGEVYKAVKVEVSDEVTVGTAVIVIDIED